MTNYYLNLTSCGRSLYITMILLLLISARTQAETTSINTGSSPTITILKTDGTEGLPDVSFTIAFSPGVTVAAPTTITYSLTGTAMVYSDYSGSTSGTITIPAGANSATLILPIIDDMVVENTETITITTGTVSNSIFPDITIGNSPNSLTIADNDNVPANKSITLTKTDGYENGAVPSFHFSFPSGVTVATHTTIAYTLSGTAIAGVDYSGSTSGTITIPAGANSVTLSLPAIDDEIVEGSETVILTTGLVTNGEISGFTISNSPQTADISDNDFAAITISNESVTEGNDGQKTIGLSVELNKATSVPFTINYATADETAKTSDNDYTSTSGTLIFNGTAGETKTISVNVTGDQKIELDETFKVDLSNLSENFGGRLSIAGSPATITILNDDAETTLPLQLVFFGAKLSDNKVGRLDWKISNEVNASHFVVERGTNQRFDSIGVIPITTSSNYHFIDYKLSAGINYYRLKIVDKNGEFAYSKIEKLDSPLNKEAQFRVFPNPAVNSVSILHPTSSNATLEIYNVEGKIEKTFKIPAGTSQSQLSVSDLATGTYIVKWQSDNQKLFGRLIKD